MIQFQISRIYQSEAVAESIRIETQKEEEALKKINKSLSKKQGK